MTAPVTAFFPLSVLWRTSVSLLGIVVSGMDLRLTSANLRNVVSH